MDWRSLAITLFLLAYALALQRKMSNGYEATEAFLSGIEKDARRGGGDDGRGGDRGAWQRKRHLHPDLTLTHTLSCLQATVMIGTGDSAIQTMTIGPEGVEEMKIASMIAVGKGSEGTMTTIGEARHPVGGRMIMGGAESLTATTTGEAEEVAMAAEVMEEGEMTTTEVGGVTTGEEVEEAGRMRQLETQVQHCEEAPLLQAQDQLARESGRTASGTSLLLVSRQSLQCRQRRLVYSAFPGSQEHWVYLAPH